MIRTSTKLSGAIKCPPGTPFRERIAYARIMRSLAKSAASVGEVWQVEIGYELHSSHGLIYVTAGNMPVGGSWRRRKALADHGWGVMTLKDLSLLERLS